MEENLLPDQDKNFPQARDEHSREFLLLYRQKSLLHEELRRIKSSRTYQIVRQLQSSRSASRKFLILGKLVLLFYLKELRDFLSKHLLDPDTVYGDVRRFFLRKRYGPLLSPELSREETLHRIERLPTSLQAELLRLKLQGLAPHSDPQETLAYLKQLYQIETSLASLIEVTKYSFNSGNFNEFEYFFSILNSYPQTSLTSGDRRWMRVVQGWLKLNELTNSQRPPRSRSLDANPTAMAYFLHNSLPDDSGGYATRSQQIIDAMTDYDFQIRCYTRAGYPWDRGGAGKKSKIGSKMSHRVGRVRYHRLDFPRLDFSQRPIDLYLEESSKIYENLLLSHHIGIVHACSNYYTGLPAMLAARRAGILAVYEIRGLWEVTRITKSDSWKQSFRYDLDKRLEAYTAQCADHVFVLTQAIRDEMESRGVPGEKMTVTPNCVNPNLFAPQERNAKLAESLGICADDVIVGFIGSIMPYEGMDDLLDVMPALVARCPKVKLLVVGDGPELDRLTVQAKQLNLKNVCIFTGRVPFSRIVDYYSLVDIAIYPRKPWEVCEMVSPIKPFEAMAMQKTVLVSDVLAMKEFISEGKNGFTFAKGSKEDLLAHLVRLVDDADLRRKLGESSRSWVIHHRSWDLTINRMRAVYDELIDKHYHHMKTLH